MSVSINLDSVGVKFPLSKAGLKTTLFSSIFRRKNEIELFSALSDINIRFNKGDRVGLMGSNGAGKTTLLRILSGILPPTSGQITIRGRVAPLVNRNPTLMPSATCAQNIILNGARNSLKGEELNSYAASVKEISGMEKFMESPFGILSAGMKNRLALSMLYVQPSDILIMDEWVGTLDKKVLSNSEGMLKSIIENSKIFILASHRRQILKEHCRTFIKLEEGKLVDTEAGFTSHLD